MAEQAQGPAPRERVFIGIDVMASGRISVALYVDGRWNAIYAPCDRETALRRQLPEVLREAVEFAQAPAASTE